MWHVDRVASLVLNACYVLMPAFCLAMQAFMQMEYMYRARHAQKP